MRLWMLAGMSWLAVCCVARSAQPYPVTASQAVTFAHTPMDVPDTKHGQPNILPLQFFADDRPAPTFGFSQDRWWALTKVPHQDGAPILFLQYNAPIADRLAAFLRCGKSDWAQMSNVPGRKTLFFVGQAHAGCDVLLLQESHAAIQFDIGWLSAAALADTRGPTLIGVTLGTSLTMGALSFVLWMATRRRELLYFLAYQVASCIVMQNVWGSVPDTPRLGSQWLSDFVGVAALNIWVLGYLGFMRGALYFKATHPRLDRAMDGLLVLFIVTMICRGFGLLLTGPLTVSILLLSTVCYWVVVVLQWNVDRQRSIQQLAGFSPTIVGSILFSFFLAGYLREDDLRGPYLLGQLASTLALGFWIAQTFRRDRDQRETRLMQTVHELEGNRAELERYQGDLEDMVAARTSELQRALSRERAVVAQQRDFTAMVGHEFRTPLAVIDGQARRIGSAAGTEADLLRRAREIRDAVRDMIGLMDGLLFHAKHEGSAPEYRFETLGLAELLRQAIESSIPRHRLLDLTADCPADVLVRADRTLLVTAFGNILGNAAKYSADGTPIKLLSRVCADVVELSVTDNGAGIAPGDMEAIFARFQRGSNVFTTPGSGLGLFISQQIIEGHGGTISVQSSLNNGSCFTVRLPFLSLAGIAEASLGGTA